MRGRKVVETVAVTTVVAEAVAPRISVTDVAGAGDSRAPDEKKAAPESGFHSGAGGLSCPQPHRLRVAGSRPYYSRQSSSNDRSRTAPLSADMTSFA